MKIKERIDACVDGVFFVVVFVFFLPFCLLYLLFQLILTPFHYIKFKYSRYQQDFPCKYRWLAEPHSDSVSYATIKENHLPVDYIKWGKDYDLNGYFLYKDILLVFREPFFFDGEKGLWLCWMREENTDETLADWDEPSEEENTDDCLTVEAATEFLLHEFQSNICDRKCNHVVFFYQQKNVVNDFGDDALAAMLANDNFVVYEKGNLADAIKNFTENT